MIGGIPAKRLVLYLAVAAVLIGANLWRWQPTGDTAAPAVSDRAVMPIVDTPTLALARDLQMAEMQPGRDLFRRGAAMPEPAPEPDAPLPPAPDPERAARLKAAEAFESMRLLGVMGTGENMLAVLEYQGQAANLAEGMDIIPDYTVTRISVTTIQIENKSMGLTGILTVADGGSTEVLGINP